MSRILEGQIEDQPNGQRGGNGIDARRESRAKGLQALIGSASGGDRRQVQGDAVLLMRPPRQDGPA